LELDGGDQQIRPRESSLQDITAAVGSAHVAEMQKHNIKNIARHRRKLEDFTDLSKATVNDLDDPAEAL